MRSLGRGERVRLHGHRRAWEVREAFGVLLQEWPWTWYMTWTFRNRMGEEGAARAVRAHLRLVEYWSGEEVGWVFGLEQERGADRVHAHGLICGGEALYMEPYWRAWMDRYGAGRFAKVVDRAGATLYCSKYAVKRGQVYLSENLERFRGGGWAHERSLDGVVPDDLRLL